MLWSFKTWFCFFFVFAFLSLFLCLVLLLTNCNVFSPMLHRRSVRCSIRRTFWCSKFCSVRYAIGYSVRRTIWSTKWWVNVFIFILSRCCFAKLWLCWTLVCSIYWLCYRISMFFYSFCWLSLLKPGHRYPFRYPFGTSFERTFVTSIYGTFFYAKLFNDAFRTTNQT